MAQYELMYLGRLILVETMQRDRGGWCWRYSIDNGDPRESEGTPMIDEHFARKEAEKLAMQEIARNH